MSTPKPQPGDRVEDGGVMGTLVRCATCSGDGLLHKPDHMPPTAPPKHQLDSPGGVAELVANIGALGRTAAVLDEVAAERQRQDAKWGEQNHPDGTGGGNSMLAAVGARLACQLAAEEGSVSWRDIMREEVGEAFAETDPAKLRPELVQAAAVLVAWIECVDRRAALASATEKSGQ